ncbi:MAG: hypothetical protein WDZ77_00270 [Candidatus Pacearchaeota archaeon]
MVKKRLLLITLVLFVSVLALSLINAQAEGCGDEDENCKINAAYSCLNDEIEERECENLSPEELTFSFLAIGQCRDEALDNPRYLGDLKYTSQILIGLGNSRSDSDEARDWILDQERPSEGLDWFLEIDSQEATACEVISVNSNTIEINEDKSIDSLIGGGCLSIDSGGYWMEINPTCYDANFTISCDQSFITTLLYQTQDSETIYVSEQTSSASAGGVTTEKINSLCFSTSVGSCNYEGSLWASMALSIAGEETSNYLQYLTASAEDNQNLLPEAFLYFITGDTTYRNQLLAKQINNKWWTSLNDRFYGTALALFPLQFEEVLQKKDSEDWLLNEAQNPDGCWDSGNIRNTAFILNSLWPRDSFFQGNGSGGIGNGSDVPNLNCQNSGYFCSSSINCNGDILPGYSCSGSFVCCSQQTPIETCSDQGGNVCSQSQVCVGIGSAEVPASGLSFGQSCCVSGSCQAPPSGSEGACESSGGECRVNGCQVGEEESFSLSCSFSSDACCLPESDSSSGGSSLVWILVLLILIILVVLAIIFRENLKVLFFRMKSKFSKDKKGPFQRPMSRPSRLLRRPIRRNVQKAPILPATRPNPPRTSPQKPRGELDDVLKRLKEIGK